MKFLGSVLPANTNRWTCVDGSMSEESMILHPGGYISCTLTSVDLAYIPEAFQIDITHDAQFSWKTPLLYVRIDITFKDGSFANLVTPLDINADDTSAYTTTKLALMPAGEYLSLIFTIVNDSDVELTITDYTLCPSSDLSDALYNSISSLLPSVLYAYNTAAVVAQAAIETQVLQLSVTVGADVYLILHVTMTGTCSADTIICTVKMDSEIIKSFPIAQTFLAGSFYIGLPSLLAFVAKGTRVVSVHLTSTNNVLNLPINGVMLCVDGKGIIGAAGTTIPHAEVITSIPLAGTYNYIEQEVNVALQEPDIYPIAATIPMVNDNITPVLYIDVRHFGATISFKFKYSDVTLNPFDTDMFIALIDGVGPQMAYTAYPTMEILADCIITTTEQIKAHPVYTMTITEELI